MAEFVDQLRDGDTSDLHDDDDEREAIEDAAVRESLRRPTSVELGPPQQAVLMPPVLRRIFGTPAEDELMALAGLLDPANRKTLTLVYHTPIGDVRTPVNWSSHAPENIAKARDLLLMMVRSADSAFAPNPGAEIEISFAEHKDRPRLRVVCLAAPQRLYPGVAVDLLCFLPQTATVEKNGKLNEKAPSVVSGLPSDDVDDTGEPVVHGEKSASTSAAKAFAAPPEDFDRVREG